MRILITGAQGMLGQDLVRVFSSAGDEVRATDKNDLDITDRDAVLRYVAAYKPDVIINAAAYNLVDKVEEPEVYGIALAINADGPRNLAEAAKNNGARFVHYSTDYVFAGDKPEGYVESDQPSPISKYGETKLAGEKAVQEVGGDWYILRTSKIFGKPGASGASKESFVALMLRLAAEKPALKIVDEEVGCPTYTPDIAEATRQILVDSRPSGIYHVVNEGAGVTWYQFAEEFFKLMNVQTPREPVSSAEFPKPASRPKLAALKNTKLPPLRDRGEALKEFLN